MTDEQVADLIARKLESAPANATHWSTRSMAAKTGLSQSTVSRVWRAFGLQPHRTETFKLTDPFFVGNVHDVVGLYLDPPERALVLCVDEESQIQALDRSQPVVPMMPGVPELRTHDDVCAGTTTPRIPRQLLQTNYRFRTPVRRVRRLLLQTSRSPAPHPRR
ncbi:hypothetical protein GCM10023205_81880 [Yinghuangia aomiensis]|uniref:Uncharacterized protein n=1 Tax=Yinghuangia aomiensis TaxID=676205 RepID=A0ABP9IG10_9ACTN